MNNIPFVSVIIPTHNRSAMLERAVQSVLRQTYKNFECIIVDDASTDDTPDVLKKLSNRDARIKHIRHENNRFSCATRNSGIRISSGNFIAFLDDDDEWLPKKLEKQIALISSLPDSFGLVYCWMDYYDTHGRLVRQYHPALKGDVFRDVVTGNKIGGTPTLLIRRQFLDRAGWWDESLRIEEDDNLIARISRCCLVDYVSEVLVRVNIGHGSQVSRQCMLKTDSYLNSISASEKLLSMALEAGPACRRQVAVLHARLGNHYARVGMISKSFTSFFKAFRSSAVEWENIHMLLSLAKWGLVGRRK